MNHRGEVVKAGYLVKSPPEKPGKVAQWHKRWFVLADSRLVYPLADRYVRLEYYQSEGEARKMADPKGTINLNTCTQVANREPIKGHKHVFDVCTAERIYHLAADSIHEKCDWIMTLNDMLFREPPKQSASPQGQKGHRLSPPHSNNGVTRRVDSHRGQRPVSYSPGDSRAPSRPLPALPSARPRNRPLPPPPSHLQPHQHHAHGGPPLSSSLNNPSSHLPSTNYSPLLTTRSVSQPFDISEHYEVGPGQRSVVPAPVPSKLYQNTPPQPNPRSRRPVLNKASSRGSSVEYINTDNGASVEYVNTDNGAEVESEYSYLEESNVTGFDPNSDDYSHLENVPYHQRSPGRLRRTHPEKRPSRIRQAYENVPHLQRPEDDDYSHLEH